MAKRDDDIYTGTAKFCDACFEEKQEINAEYFCLQCNEYLCCDCKNYHKKANVTKSHELMCIENVHCLSSLTFGSDSFETPVCRDHEQEIQYFCKSHMEELCSTCKLMTHTTCKTIIGLKQATKDIFSDKHCEMIEKSMKDLLASFASYKRMLVGNKGKLFDRKTQAIDNMKEMRRKIEVQLDQLEVDAIKKIEKVCYEETKSLNEKLQICDATITTLKRRLSDLEKASLLDHAEGRLIVINRTTKETKQYGKVVHDLFLDSYDAEIEIKWADKHTDLRKTLPNFFSVSLRRNPVESTSFESPVLYGRQISWSSSMKNQRPLVNSYDCLADGRQFLLDVSNQRLGMFDLHGNVLSEITIPDIKDGEAILYSNTEAIVSTFGKTLVLIGINDRLRITKTLQLKFRVGPIVKYGDNLLVVFDHKGLAVSVMDKKGNIKRTIFKNDGTVLKNPMKIAYDNNQIYVLDFYTGLFALSFGGQILFHYVESATDEYHGLAIANSSLFVAVISEQRETIRRLSLDGSKISDLYLPFSFPLKIRGNELVMASLRKEESAAVHFYYILK